MEEHDEMLRPGRLLTEFRNWSGMTPTRVSSPSDEAKLYGLVSQVTNRYGDRQTKWVTLAVRPSPDDALTKIGRAHV